MLVLQVIGAILLIIAMILTPMYVLYVIVKFFWTRFVEKPGSIISSSISAYDNEKIRKIDFKNAELILISKFRYYQKLDDRQKTRFLKRVIRFIAGKEFKTLGGLAITEEMVVLISASAVQLTFGLKEYELEHFHRIFIYPKEFYSRSNKTYNKGETNSMGAIVLSWTDFQKGYAHESDNINLGLHEMTHALKLDQLFGGSDNTFTEYLQKWQQVAKEEFTKLKNKEDSIFREYGGSNMTEFFSVCVEYFFESPGEFKKQLPELYKHLAILLNQDPAVNSVNNTFIPRTEPEETGPEKMFKNRERGQLLPAILLVINAIAIFRSLQLRDYEFLFVSCILFVLILVFGIITLANDKTSVVVHSRKIIFSTYFTERFYSTYHLEELVSLTFIKGREYPKERYADKLQVAYLYNGQIRHKRYTFQLPEDEMEQLRVIMNGKKIPVLFDGFDRWKRKPIPR